MNHRNITNFFAIAFPSLLVFLGILFTASAPANGKGYNEFFSKVKTGSVEVSPLDEVSVTISYISGKPDVEFRVYFLDELGTRLSNYSQGGFNGLKFKQSKVTKTQIPDFSRNSEPPSLIRAVVQVQGGCGPGKPSSFIIHGTHTSAASGTIHQFSACPIVVCTGKSDDDPPALNISGHCGVQHQ